MKTPVSSGCVSSNCYLPDIEQRSSPGTVVHRYFQAYLRNGYINNLFELPFQSNQVFNLFQAYLIRERRNQKKKPPPPKNHR